MEERGARSSSPLAGQNEEVSPCLGPVRPHAYGLAKMRNGRGELPTPVGWPG